MANATLSHDKARRHKCGVSVYLCASNHSFVIPNRATICVLLAGCLLRRRTCIKLNTIGKCNRCVQPLRRARSLDVGGWRTAERRRVWPSSQARLRSSDVSRTTWRESLQTGTGLIGYSESEKPVLLWPLSIGYLADKAENHIHVDPLQLTFCLTLLYVSRYLIK